MLSRSPALSALLIALLAAVPAWADEPATPVSPSAAYAAKVAALPAPKAENGFYFAGVLRVGGKNLGHATFFARPDKKDAALWRAGDLIVIKTAPVPKVRIAEAFLSQTLGLLRGGLESNEPDDVAVKWAKSETGFRGTTVASKGQVTTEKVRNFEHAGTALTTLAATILFARSVLPAKASYATTIFEARAAMKGEQALQAVTLEVLGEQTLQGKQVLVVRGRKEGMELELLFKPEGRELMAVIIVEGKERVEILKADVWSMPAADPVTASMRAALALSTANIDLLGDTFHWPSLYKSYLAKRAGKANSLPIEDYRKTLLAKFEKTLGKNPVPMMQTLLASVKPQLKVNKLASGEVEVLYPQMFRNLKLTLGKEYGYWHVVALPGIWKAGEYKPQDAPKKKSASGG